MELCETTETEYALHGARQRHQLKLSVLRMYLEEDRYPLLGVDFHPMCGTGRHVAEVIKVPTV